MFMIATGMTFRTHWCREVRCCEAWIKHKTLNKSTEPVSPARSNDVDVQS